MDMDGAVYNLDLSFSRVFTLFQLLIYPHNLDPTNVPPSNAIVAPLTYEPALLLKNKHAPATSCGLPILPSGIPLLITSPKSLNVAAIILLSNGPQAKVLLVMFLFPKWLASVLLRWCKPALLALYEKVSREGTRRPSTEPILIIRAGSAGVAAASKRGVTSCVMEKTRVRFRVSTRAQAASGNSSKGAPQLLPELLTRI